MAKLKLDSADQEGHCAKWLSDWGGKIGPHVLPAAGTLQLSYSAELSSASPEFF